jgi:hypothetical protein
VQERTSPGSGQAAGGSLFPAAKISSLFLAVTLTHTFVGSKTKNITGSGAHLNALAFAMLSMGLALALGVVR